MITHLYIGERIIEIGRVVFEFTHHNQPSAIQDLHRVLIEIDCIRFKLHFYVFFLGRFLDCVTECKADFK